MRKGKLVSEFGLKLVFQMQGPTKNSIVVIIRFRASERGRERGQGQKEESNDLL